MARILSDCPGEPVPVDRTLSVQAATQAAEPASPPASPPAPPPPAAPAPPAPAAGGTDPQFGTCRQAQANGYGPYLQGRDPEYAWYRDGDGDGSVCE